MSDAGTTAATGDSGAANANATTAAAQTAWYEPFKTTNPEFVGDVQTRGLADKTPADAALNFYKAHLEHKQMISRLTGTPDKDRIIVQPKPDAPEAERTAYYEKLGRPAKAEDYDFTGIKFPDGTDLDDDFVSTLKNASFKANVSKDAAAAIARELTAYVHKIDEGEAAKTALEIQQASEKLNQSWGANRQAFQFIADQGLAKLAESAKLTPEQTKTALVTLANSVGRFEAAQMLLAVGKAFGEDKYVSGPTGGNMGLMTREQAKAALDQLKMERGPDSFGAKLRRNDAEAINKFNALTAMMVGQEG